MLLQDQHRSIIDCFGTLGSCTLAVNMHWKRSCPCWQQAFCPRSTIVLRSGRVSHRHVLWVRMLFEPRSLEISPVTFYSGLNSNV